MYRKVKELSVQDSIRYRHNHNGYMAEFKYAKALVERSIKDGEEPELASWF